MWTTNIYEATKWKSVAKAEAKCLEENIQHTLCPWYQNFVIYVVMVMRRLWMGRGVLENEQEMMECLHLCDMNYFYPVFVAASGFLNSARESWHKVIAQEQEQPDDNRNIVCALFWGLFTVLFQVIYWSAEKPCN